MWRASRWLQAAAVVLATVGALTLAAQSGKVDDGVSSGAAVPQEDPGAALPQEEVADDAAVEIQVGRSAMVRVEGEISAVSASDPEVIRAMQISPRSVQVQGTSVGEAVLRVEMRPGSADDEEYRFSVIATDQTPRPPSNPSIQTEPDEVISLQVGESQVVDFHGRVPSAVVMTAPEVCNPTVMAQPSQLKLSGIGIGITDLHVFFGVDQPGRYFHIEVE